MKALFFSKRALLALCLSASLFVVSCDKDDDDIDDNTEVYAVSGSGSGSQVVPSVSTTATSSITGTYNTSNRNLQYTISWTGLAGAANAVRFYGPAAIGSNATGDAQYNVSITTAGITGSATGDITLTAAQETDLLSGNWYYTVGNATYLAGEIRGQLVVSPQ